MLIDQKGSLRGERPLAQPRPETAGDGWRRPETAGDGWRRPQTAGKHPQPRVDADARAHMHADERANVTQVCTHARISSREERDRDTGREREREREGEREG